ncbi:hypothetical protein PBY51_000928 [Eleginops maclovinus]|uniref:Uncharacterized protein n=1 Tax=Eleginops maclovinus TaxID=56733 RepID=A0AAN7XKV4_ELEMC|nr:hypothetical protein PBY51_000928 [Eleginops maclovinus]
MRCHSESSSVCLLCTCAHISAAKPGRVSVCLCTLICVYQSELSVRADVVEEQTVKLDQTRLSLPEPPAV